MERCAKWLRFRGARVKVEGHMVHSQVTRRIDNQSVIINRNGFVFEFLTPSKRIERLDENNSSLLSDHIHIHPCAPINPIVYSSVIIRFRWRRKKERKKNRVCYYRLKNQEINLLYFGYLDLYYKKLLKFFETNLSHCDYSIYW